jgi:RNA polymerase sigma-70 factor (ECF subfamily)
LRTDSIKTLENYTDGELVQRIQAKDVVAFELLMRRNNQTLYRAARSILKNEEEAEEAVQDAYLKAYSAIDDFRAGAALTTWLTRIVINEALGRRRKHQRRAELIQLNKQLERAPDSEEGFQMQHHAAGSPVVNAERTETRRLIERNIDQLPEAFRSVFVLRALEEMTVQETASCLGIPDATVRSRFFRARGLMREAIAQEIDLGYDDAFHFAGARCDRIVANVLTLLAEHSTSANPNP